jgi:putative nucleotidyltransferase with HDIG domain
MEYISVRVSTLRGDQNIPFNLYVHLNDKHILYIRKGDSFEGTRLEKLKSKKLKKMFILIDDEQKYRSYLSLNMDVALDKNSKKSIEDRSQIVQGAIQASAEEVIENIESAEAYNTAKLGADQYVQFILNNDKALKSIVSVENSEQDIYHHGVTVSCLAVGLAQKLGLTNPKQLQILTMGALMHDIGHTFHTVSVSRSLSEMSAADLATYKSHSQIGADRVRNLKHFDVAVTRIILEHEECINGSGFPSGIRENKFDELAQLVAITNKYDRLVTYEKHTPDDAIKKMLVEYIGRYSLNHLKELKSVLVDKGITK